MPVIQGEQVSETKIIVRSVGYSTNTPPEGGNKWYVVPSVPLPHEYPKPSEPGKSPQLIFNPQTGEFSFEFIDVPITPDEEKLLLEEEVRELQQKVQELENLLEAATELLLENEVL